MKADKLAKKRVYAIMKRYIKSATDVNVSNIKIVTEQVINGITVRIRPFLTEQSEYDKWLQDSNNCRIVQNFVAGALDCAIQAAGHDKDLYDYYLNVLVNLKYLAISCYFGSACVNPKWYSSGRGGHSSEAQDRQEISDSSENNWSYFLEECKRVVREVHAEYRKLQKAQNILEGVPNNIIGDCYKFKYWIVSEKLGGNEVDEAGEAWLLSRTYNNSRGSYYNNKNVFDEITELFDWLIDNNYSYADLKQLVNAATVYILRSPQRHIFDYDSLTNN